MAVEHLADRRRDRLPDLLAQARPVFQQDDDAAQGAHLVRAGHDLQLDAEVGANFLPQALELIVARDVLDPVDQLLLFHARQAQGAQVGAGLDEQALALADAGAWRTFSAEWEAYLLQHALTLAGKGS